MKALLTGMDKNDPLPRRQKALTPDFLTDMHRVSREMGKEWHHTSDLVRGAYFFAMRACEFCKTEVPGRTRRLTTANITFRDHENKVVPHEDPHLEEKAYFVTICFVDQKNGERMERRSQRRSGVPILCPIESWAAVVKRNRSDFPDSKDLTVCSHKIGRVRAEVTASQVTKLLRKVCALNNGKDKYGISESELGTRSIRSGAAMALAVQGGHTDEKIRILGRWKSLAFLTYIRPQVLEWSGGMASDMVKTKSFTDLSELRGKKTDQKTTSETKRPPKPTNQPKTIAPRSKWFDVA